MQWPCKWPLREMLLYGTRQWTGKWTGYRYNDQYTGIQVLMLKIKHLTQQAFFTRGFLSFSNCSFELISWWRNPFGRPLCLGCCCCSLMMMWFVGDTKLDVEPSFHLANSDHITIRLERPWSRVRPRGRWIHSSQAYRQFVGFKLCLR